MATADTVDYDDSDDALVTGEAVSLDLRPASFVLRAAGAAIDWLVSVVLYVGAIWAIVAILDDADVPGALVPSLAISLWVLCFIAVPMTVELASRGKSLGRLATGVRIVRDDGGAAGVRHAFVRAVVGAIEFFVLLGGPAAIAGLLTRRSKRIGDLLAGTYGQYERVSRQPAPVFGVPAPLVDWARIADVGRLPVPLARRISQFLAQAPKLDPGRRVALARSLATEASAWVSPLPDVDAELFLAAVSVLRRERYARALDIERRRLDALAPALDGLPRGFPDRG